MIQKKNEELTEELKTRPMPTPSPVKKDPYWTHQRNEF